MCLHLIHMTFAKAGCPDFLFVVGAVACAAGLLFWPVKVIIVGFFTVSKLSNYGQCGSSRLTG